MGKDGELVDKQLPNSGSVRRYYDDGDRRRNRVEGCTPLRVHHLAIGLEHFLNSRAAQALVLAPWSLSLQDPLYHRRVLRH